MAGVSAALGMCKLMLLKRILTSTALISGTFAILLFTGPLFFGLEVCLFVGLALFEFFSLLRKANIPVYRFFGVSMGVLIPLIVTMELGTAQSGEILFLVLGCLSLFLLQFSRKDNAQALIGISLTQQKIISSRKL